MRKIKIEIDAGKKYCGGCEYRYTDYGLTNCPNWESCQLFRTGDLNITLALEMDSRGYLRLQECLDAEKEGNNEQ